MPRGSSPIKVLCIFCDQRRERAREDVISNWISGDLGGIGPFYTDLLTVIPSQPMRRRTRKSGSLASLKLPDVCEICNRGWMSGLERLTIPILRRMMQEERVCLTPAAQRQVTAWVHLKGITLDAYYGTLLGEHRLLPPVVAHEFCDRLQPIPGCDARLGNSEPFPEGVGIPFARRMMEGDQAHLGGVNLKAVRVTFAYKHLFAQTTIGWIEELGQPTHIPPQANGDRFIKLWPFPRVPRDLYWPPGVLIRLQDFKGLL